MITKVQPGQEIEIAASTWNSFIDAANYVSSIQSDSSGNILKGGLGGGTILVRNGESSTFPQFSAMALGDILIKPATSLQEFKCRTPVFLGRKAVEANPPQPYAILLEPIASQKIGRALLLGLVPAQVSILDAEHQFAEPIPGSATGMMRSAETGVARIIWKGGNSGNQWCLLQLGGAGSGNADDKVVMCKIVRGSNDAGYSVIVYAEGKESESTGEGILYMAELALNSTIPSGSWVIGHRTMLKMTGGNES